MSTTGTTEQDTAPVDETTDNGDNGSNGEGMDEYRAIAAYGEKVKALRAMQPAFDDLSEQFNALNAERDTLLSDIQELVNTYLHGADPFGVVKASQRAPRKSGPRDPNRRTSVIEAMSEPRTLGEITSATGEDTGFVTGVIQALAKTGNVKKSGERGSFKYLYVPTDDEDDQSEQAQEDAAEEAAVNTPEPDEAPEPEAEAPKSGRGRSRKS